MGEFLWKLVYLCVGFCFLNAVFCTFFILMWTIIFWLILVNDVCLQILLYFYFGFDKI